MTDSGAHIGDFIATQERLQREMLALIASVTLRDRVIEEIEEMCDRADQMENLRGWVKTERIRTAIRKLNNGSDESRRDTEAQSGD